MKHRLMLGGVSVVALLALGACGSSTGGAGDAPLEPLAYCAAVAPVWDSNAIPNADDELSGAERATAVSDLREAIQVLPQGVSLNAVTQQKSDVLVKALPVIVALYEDPTLIDADSATIAERTGLSTEEVEDMKSVDDSRLGEAVQSLTDYCQPRD